MFLTEKYCSAEEKWKVQQFVRCTSKKIQLLSFNSLGHLEESFFFNCDVDTLSAPQNRKFSFV